MTEARAQTRAHATERERKEVPSSATTLRNVTSHVVTLKRVSRSKCYIKNKTVDYVCNGYGTM